MPSKTVKLKRGKEMDADEAGIEKNFYYALWEDSRGLEDEMTAMVEEELQCQKCLPQNVQNTIEH